MSTETSEFDFAGRVSAVMDNPADVSCEQASAVLSIPRPKNRLLVRKQSTLKTDARVAETAGVIRRLGYLLDPAAALENVVQCQAQTFGAGLVQRSSIPRDAVINGCECSNRETIRADMQRLRGTGRN